MFPSTTRPSFPTALSSRLVRRIAGMYRCLGAQLHTWRARARARRELRELDGAILRDIGLSRTQANFDADQPYWRDRTICATSETTPPC